MFDRIDVCESIDELAFEKNNEESSIEKNKNI